MKEDNLTAILSYIGILFIIPLLAKKNKEFNRFHAKQGIILFIAEFATILFITIPVVGWIAAPILFILWSALSVIGIINVARGIKNGLPLIGRLSDKFEM